MNGNRFGVDKTYTAVETVVVSDIHGSVVVLAVC
jgi:hypothetical protein